MLDLVRVAFKASLAQTSPGSLRHRHISLLLVCNNTSIKCGKIERYQKRLMSRGVCKENVLLLRRDTMIPFSQQLGMIWPLSKEGKQERIKKRSTMAENTEKDVNECMVTLEFLRLKWKTRWTLSEISLKKSWKTTMWTWALLAAKNPCRKEKAVHIPKTVEERGPTNGTLWGAILSPWWTGTWLRLCWQMLGPRGLTWPGLILHS